jgi:hypothetical protein
MIGVLELHYRKIDVFPNDCIFVVFHGGLINKNNTRFKLSIILVKICFEMNVIYTFQCKSIILLSFVHTY